MPPLAAGVEFLDAPLAIFGLLLVAGALVSGIAQRTFLSLTAAFVVAGFLLGEGGLDVLELDPRSGFVQGLTVIALILILFGDGLEVEQEMLQEAWHLPVRNLVLGMPLTAGLVALGTHILTDLDWTESFLVGAPGRQRRRPRAQIPSAMAATNTAIRPLPSGASPSDQRSPESLVRTRRSLHGVWGGDAGARTSASASRPARRTSSRRSSSGSSSSSARSSH